MNATSSALLGTSADMSYAPGVAGTLGVSYPPMKAGIIGLTKTLANFGAEYGIKVDAVAPTAATRITPDRLRQDRAALLAAIRDALA